MKVLSLLLLVLPVASPAKLLNDQPQSSKAHCVELVVAEWTESPGTNDESSDRLAVCQDGKLNAVHIGPAIGPAPGKRTKWEYDGQISSNAISDLLKVINRNDIRQLPAQVDVKKPAPPPPFDSFPPPRNTLRFSLARDNDAQVVTLVGLLYLECEEKNPEMSETVRDLVCLFDDLYDRAKTATPRFEGNCGCKTLHAMATSISQQAQ